MSKRVLMIAGTILTLGLVAIVAVVQLVSESARWRSVEERFPDIRVAESSNQRPPGPSSAPKSEARPALRFAIAPVISPEDSYLDFKKLVDLIAASLGREGVIITRSSYGEINELIQDGHCDLALVCTYSYIQAKREFGAQLLAIPIVEGSRSYQSYYIVPNDSEVTQFPQLKGKTFAYADADSTSGWIYPAVALMNGGFDPLDFFSMRIRKGSHDRAILATAYGEVESAAVDSIVFDNMSPEIKNKLKVIHRSPQFGMPPLITPAGVDEALRERLLEVLLALHNTQRGREVLEHLKIERFERTSHAAYQSVEILIEQWEAR